MGTEPGDIYDIKPDKNSKPKVVSALPRRVRFYHSKIDAKGLRAGEDYQNLKNVIIIMILSYDPFGLDRMVYTVQTGCREEPDMPYEDGARTLFLYTGGTRGVPSEELRQMLAYFACSTEENACNEELREIHGMLSKVRQDEEVELNYMKIFEQEQMIREDGIEEGEELHLIQLILKKVSKGRTLETIAEELESEVEDIAKLYDIIKSNPDKTREEIFELYHN